MYFLVGDRYEKPLTFSEYTTWSLFFSENAQYSLASHLSPTYTTQKQEFSGSFGISVVPSRDMLVLSFIWRGWT